MKYDLHTHSYYSDGVSSPEEVVKYAKKKGVKILALTDHNSLEGIEEAVQTGKKLGVEIIPAIEIRAKEDEVLGYFVDFKNSQFKNEIRKIQQNLSNRVKKIIKKLNEKGISVSYSNLIKEYKPNKENFMEIHLIKYLVKQGMGVKSELWKKYISKEGETYIPLREISVPKAIRLIKKFHGIPVLAHPWAEKSSKELLEEDKFKKLVTAGLKGIEIDNGDRDERRDKETIQKIEYLAKKYDLIITSGSDFHGEKLIDSHSNHDMGDNIYDLSAVGKLKKLHFQ
jgi:hypothetical protein